MMDLRVEDHPQPITELRRLVGLHRAYRHMNQGDEGLGKGEVERALEEYRTADRLTPDSEEIRFWHAVTLADAGRLEEALPLFREVFARNPRWATLLDRLGTVGLVGYDAQTIQRILSAARD